MEKLYPIPGFSKYCITKSGCVYSTHRKKLCKRKTYIKVGYRAIDLYEKGREYKTYIHTLLLRTFKGNADRRKYCCRHLDGNRLNNDLNNIVWGTYKENQLDRRRHGTCNGGERHPNAKLTYDNVLEIKRLASIKKRKAGQAGSDYNQIAKNFNISPSTVGGIVRGERWNTK